MNLTNAKAKIVGQIKGYEDYETYCKALKKHFEKGQFKQMARLLGKHTLLFTPDGRRLMGEEDLTGFWRSAKKKVGPGTQVYIDFDEQCVYKREIEKKDRIQKKHRKTIVDIAHVIIEFRIISNKPGGTATNSTGSYVQNLPHREDCMWEP